MVLSNAHSMLHVDRTRLTPDGIGVASIQLPVSVRLARTSCTRSPNSVLRSPSIPTRGTRLLPTLRKSFAMDNTIPCNIFFLSVLTPRTHFILGPLFCVGRKKSASCRKDKKEYFSEQKLVIINDKCF